MMNLALLSSTENASELSATPFVVCQAVEICIIECLCEVHIVSASMIARGKEYIQLSICLSNALL